MAYNAFLNCSCYELKTFSLGMHLLGKPTPSHGIHVAAKLSEPQDRTEV